MPDPVAGQFSDWAVTRTNHRKPQAASAAAGGTYVLRRLTPCEAAKVKLRDGRERPICAMFGAVPRNTQRLRVKPGFMLSSPAHIMCG